MWRLWRPGTRFKSLDGIEPILASWNRQDHPDQVRLRSYLEDLMNRIGPLTGTDPLFLVLEVDVKRNEHLTWFHDLENYLYPLFGQRRLPPQRFVFVEGFKKVGGGSQLHLGFADAIDEREFHGWTHFSCSPGAAAQTHQWKTRIHEALGRSGLPRLPAGAVRLHLAWRCSSRRNWTALWKPTGDAMGPVLGESRPFNPADDLITELGLHLETDDSLGHDVQIGMWWSQ